MSSDDGREVVGTVTEAPRMPVPHRAERREPGGLRVGGVVQLGARRIGEAIASAWPCRRSTARAVGSPAVPDEGARGRSQPGDRQAGDENDEGTGIDQGPL